MMSRDVEEKIREDLDRLARDWGRDTTRIAEEFVQIWSENLGCSVSHLAHRGNGTTLRTDLTCFRLAGIGNAPCLLIGGDGPLGREIMAEFQKSFGSERIIPIVLCSSAELYVEASSIYPKSRTILLARQHLLQILTATDPLKALRMEIIRQIPLLRLTPFTITRPVTGSMFFGREREMEQLLYSTESDFIVAGAGKIGKTSLLKEFERRVKRSQERRTVIYVDCYQHRGPEDLIRHIAMELQPGRRAFKMHFEDFPTFLRYNIPRLGKMIELVLDETDEILQMEANAGYPALKALRKAAEVGRIILGGRKISSWGSNGEIPLAGRLRILRLGALEKEPAEQLFTAPFEDMGITIDDRKAVRKHILNMAGRLPHLIQWYGGNLVSTAAQEGRSKIGMQDVRQLERQFETRYYFTSVFENIKELDAKLVALILTKNHLHQAALTDIANLTEKADAVVGNFISIRNLDEICDDLVIYNVLRWEGDSYSLANDALHHFANQAGFLDYKLQETQKELASQPVV